MSEPEEEQGGDEQRELFKRQMAEELQRRRQERMQENKGCLGGLFGFLFKRKQPEISDEEKRELLEQKLRERMDGMSDSARESLGEILDEASDAGGQGDSNDFLQSLVGGLVEKGGAALGEARSAFKEVIEGRVQERRNAPTLECPMREINRPRWLNDEPIADWIKTLEKRGFKPGGAYERPDLHCELVALGHPDLNCGVTAYCLPDLWILVVFSMTKDGVVREVSSYGPAEFVALPDWFEITVDTSDDVEAQLDRFLTGHNAETCVPINPESYVALSGDIHRRLTAWKIERGGETRGELYKQMEAGGHLPEDPDEREEFMDIVRRNDAERHLSAWWKLQDTAPCPLEEVMETMVVIHDDLSPDLLLQDYWMISENFRFKEKDLPDLPPREAFAKLMEDLDNPMKKVLEKKTGFPADFYLPA